MDEYEEYLECEIEGNKISIEEAPFKSGEEKFKARIEAYQNALKTYRELKSKGKI